MAHETIAVAMVLGTVLAAPIMLLFGFVLASATDPGSGLNATSAALDVAYVWWSVRSTLVDFICCCVVGCC